jgi:hypothetical protein
MSTTHTHSIVEAYNDIDKIHSIEEQRSRTMADPKFQQWCKDMRVSQLYTNRELIHNANRLMKQYTHKIGLEG